MPKGTKTAKTITKEQARDALRAVVIANMAEMLESQIAASKGIKYLVVREKSGKFTKLTKDQAGAAIEDGSQILELWEERPSTPAFTDLMDRALDKPAQPKQEIEVGFKDLGDKIRKARERAGSR